VSIILAVLFALTNYWTLLLNNVKKILLLRF